MSPALDAEQLVGWCGKQRWATETRRGHYASYRGFYGFYAVAYGADNPALELPRVRAAEPRPRPAPVIVVETGILEADERTALILRCAVDAGLRRGEIALICEDDLLPDLLGWSLVVHGKGRRERVIPLPDDLATDLLRACRANEGFAFPGLDAGHLSPRYVGKLANDALPGVWTIHTLRHSYATRIHDATHDLIAVQGLLGHASVATTQRYLATDATRLRRALDVGARAA